MSCVFIALFFGFREPLSEVSLFGIRWIIFKDGITMAFNTFFRVEGAIASQFFLVLTTPMTSILLILRKARIPAFLVEISSLVYKYIFVFLEIMETMHTAQELRLGYSGLLRRLRSTSMLLGTLFLRTLEQGERTFAAMNARCYNGNIHVLDDIAKPSNSTLAGIAILIAALTIISYLTASIGIVPI